MSVDGFISKLQALFEPHDSKRLIRSLHQDPLVWQALSNTDLQQGFIDFAQTQIDKWTPGYLAALTIDANLLTSQGVFDMSHELPADISKQMHQSYETVYSTSLPPETLSQAGLLTLALRDHHVVQGSWEGISNKLLVRNNQQAYEMLYKIWRSPFACLPSLIPDFISFSITLLNEIKPNLAPYFIPLIVHGLLSTPQSDSKLIDDCFNIFSHTNIDTQILSLKYLVQSGYSELVKELSENYLKLKENLSSFSNTLITFEKSEYNSNDQISFTGTNAFENVQTLQRLANLYHFAGQPQKSSEIFSYAVETLKQSQSMLYYNIALESSSYDPLSAKEAWLNSINNDPKNSQIKSDFAIFLIEQECFEEAKDLLVQISDSPVAKFLAIQNPDLTHPDEPIETNTSSIINEYFLSQTNTHLASIIKLNKKPVFLTAISILKEHKEFRSALNLVSKQLSENPNDVEILSLASDLNKRLGNMDQAIDQAALIHALKPHDPARKKELAFLYEQTEQWEKAFELHKSLIMASPAPLRKDLLNYANAAVAAGYPEVAIPICQNFLNQNQLDGEALVTLSNAYIKQGEESKAIEQMERAASIAPEEPTSWLALANAWSHLGFHDRALDTLHKAQNAIPDDPQVLLALGKAYLNNNMAAEALPVLKKGHKLDLDNPHIMTYLAKSFHVLGNTKEAWSILESLEDHFTEDPQLALILGQVLRTLNDNFKALPILKFAYQTTHNEDALLEYTHLLLDFTTKAQVSDDPEFRVQDDLEKLLLPLAKQCNTSKQPFKLRLLIADVKCALGYVKEAHAGYLELLNEPNAKAPETYCHIQFGIGKTALSLKLNEISMAALQEAIMIKPEKVEIRHALAEAYMMSEFANEGLNSAKAALQIAPNDLENILWFTQFMIKNGQTQQAILSLKNAIRIAPGQRELYITLAKTYVSLGDHAAAKSIITELTDSEDISSKDMHNAANILYQLNDVVEAVKVLKGALLKDQQPEFAVLHDLTYSLQMIGESDSTLELLREYEESFIKDPRFPALKSDILALNLQYGEALDCLRPILKKMEYTDDLFNVENASQGDLLDQDHTDYSHAGIYWRAAQLERATGDLLQAQKHAEQALDACPTQLKYLKLSVELAFETLQKDKMRSLIERMLSAINDPTASQIEPYTEIINMRCELAILEDDHETASKLLDQYLSNLPSTPYSLALQSQLADYYNEKKLSDTYFTEAQSMFTSLAENQKGCTESISERFISIWNVLALAEAAVKLQKWNTAFERFQQAICLIRVNPLVNMLYAKAILTYLQHQHTCQVLRIIKHAPGEDILDQSCQKLFEEQISIAGRFIEPRIIDHLRTKAQAVFDGHWPDHNRIEEFVKNPKDAAAILPLLDHPDEISQILGAYPDDFDVLLQYAIILMGTDPNNCREIVRKLIEIDTAYPPLHALLAFCSQDDNFIATNSIETALELWPGEPDWHAFAAQLYVQDGQYDLSAQHLEKALEIQPNEPSYWELLGEVKLREKDFNAAKMYFAKACEIFPDNPEALLSLAQINKKLGEYQSAVTCLEKANELQPTNIQVTEMLANTLLEKGDIDGTIQKAKKLLSMDESNVTAYLVYTKALILNSQSDEAQKFIKSALVKLPDSIELKIEQINLIQKTQGVNAALPHLVELANQHPDDNQVLYAFSTLLINSGSMDEAEKVIQHSLQLDPNQPQVLLQQGRLNKKKGNLDQAIADFSAAIALDPSLVDSYIELGKTHQERREHSQAIQIYKQASQVVMNDPRPYYHSGLALKECKDYKNAEVMLRQAAQLAPKDTSVRRQLAAVVALNLVHNLQEAS